MNDVFKEIKTYVERNNFLNYGSLPSEKSILDKAIEFSAKVSGGHHYRDLIIGFLWGYKSAMLSNEDINRIGELFNECQTKLEKEHPEYSDWGIPSNILANEVLKRFNEEKIKK